MKKTTSSDSSPSKLGLLANISSLDDSKASLSTSPLRRRNLNNDQEVLLDSHAPLILLNDTSTHHIVPRYSSRLLPPLKLKLQAIEQEKRPNDEHKNDQVEDPDDEGESGTDSHSGSSPSKKKAKEVNIFGGDEDEDEKRRQKYKTLTKILESVTFQVIVNILTVYALFSDDLRVILAPPSADIPFTIVAIIIMSIFVAEIVMSCFVKRDYLFSFFFFLDILGTASMLFDITWFAALMGGGSKSIGKNARGARVGARAGRIVRIVRLVRLVRIVKFAENQQEKEGDPNNPANPANPNDPKNPANKSQAKPDGSNKVTPLPVGNASSKNDTDGLSELSSPSKKTSSSLQIPTVIPPGAEDLLKESRVGKQLSNLTIKRVVTIVLLLLFIIPLFSTDYYFDPDREYTYMASDLQVQINAGLSADAVKAYVDKAVSLSKEQFKPVIKFKTPYYTYEDVDPSTLRDDDQESETVSFSSSSLGDIVVVVDKRPWNTLESELSIGRTLFISLVLVLAAIFFNKDVTDLALGPIERMIKKVNKIAANPLLAKEEELIKDENGQDENETVQIENAIIKIGTLLALGFGDAGTEIIAQNIAAGGDVNPMIRGQKRMAIFGFCDIRNFTDATEVLQEEVMVFVNSIGDIVHRIVDKYCGSANKNIGDAFLLVWKFPDEEICHPTINDIDVRSTQVVKNICDLAVISFLKIYARVNKDLKLLEYRKHEKLNQRIPNYKVKMGFGLHVGWAIEGAIGSEFKIDASYLSPNVNMASRLEAATKQYGVPLLISGALYEKCSKPVKELMRHIDKVTVKGSKLPMDFYTIDCDISKLPECTPKQLTKAEIRKRRQNSKKEIYRKIIEEEGKASALFETDKDLKAMTSGNGKGPFYELFKAGFQAYLSGDWSAAKRKLEECLNLRPDDGPTHTIYEVLKENDFITPEEWKGYRELTEK